MTTTAAPPTPPLDPAVTVPIAGLSRASFEYLRDAAHGRKLMSLFGGPARTDGSGFDDIAGLFNLDCKVLDLERDGSHDLCEQHVWDNVLTDIESACGVMMAPPCGTFCLALGKQGGPPPLRSPGRCIKGLPHLTPEQQHKVRIGNLCAERAAQAATKAQSLCIPWAIVNPEWQPGCTSIFELECVRHLINDPDVVFFYYLGSVPIWIRMP